MTAIHLGLGSAPSCPAEWVRKEVVFSPWHIHHSLDVTGAPRPIPRNRNPAMELLEARYTESLDLLLTPSVSLEGKA